MTRFRFVEAEAAQFPVSLLCRIVGVSRQGFYAWKRRRPSARELADRAFGERIRQVHAETEGICPVGSAAHAEVGAHERHLAPRVNAARTRDLRRSDADLAEARSEELTSV